MFKLQTKANGTHKLINLAEEVSPGCGCLGRQLPLTVLSRLLGSTK
jgi:hypothetical protein